MKSFLKRLLIFLLPLILGWAALIWRRIPEEYSYNYLINDCDGNGSWIYSRLFVTEQPADIVFIGASRTMRAVDDSLLQLMYDSAGIECTLLNLGYCRFGRDLQAMIAEDALNTQTGISTLVIEVSEREGISGHPVFWCMAGGNNLLLPESFLNQSYFSNIWQASVLRRDYYQQALLNPDTGTRYSRKLFGCLHTDHQGDKAELEQAKQNCVARNKCEPPGSFENFQLNYAKSWLKYIADAAKAKNCKLIFLFLPGYGCNNCPPRELEYYQSMGTVLIPPTAILNNPENWSDRDHFNTNGSRLLAPWLFGQLRSRD